MTAVLVSRHHDSLIVYVSVGSDSDLSYNTPGGASFTLSTEVVQQALHGC